MGYLILEREKEGRREEGRETEGGREEGGGYRHEQDDQ